MEHTISHLLEMFALARGSQPAAHGLQVGYGVREALRLYRKAYVFTPDLEVCKRTAACFSETEWEEKMRGCLENRRRRLLHALFGKDGTCRKIGFAAHTAQWNTGHRSDPHLARRWSKQNRLEAALDQMKIPDWEKLDDLVIRKRKPKMRENIVRIFARGIFLHRCVQILAWRYKNR